MSDLEGRLLLDMGLDHAVRPIANLDYYVSVVRCRDESIL